jgi:hypothetical protein
MVKAQAGGRKRHTGTDDNHHGQRHKYNRRAVSRMWHTRMTNVMSRLIRVIGFLPERMCVTGTWWFPNHDFGGQHAAW